MKMAVRCIFLPMPNSTPIVKVVHVEFEWFSGLSMVQKQKSVRSLHDSAKKIYDIRHILEVSSKSSKAIGVFLSAFNLQTLDNVSVEVAFQSTKVFEQGGPYLDLLKKNSIEAKKDERLKRSGRLLCFKYKNEVWPLEPRTAMYDWIYLNALEMKKTLTKNIINYEAFSDIEFNHLKSINCQARSVALYVALYKEGILSEALGSRDKFVSIINDRCANINDEDCLF